MSTRTGSLPGTSIDDRKLLAAETARLIEGWVRHPGVMDLDSERSAHLLACADALIAAWEGLTCAYSQSNPTYALTDVSIEEKNDIATARHLRGVLAIISPRVDDAGR